MSHHLTELQPPATEKREMILFVTSFELYIATLHLELNQKINLHLIRFCVYVRGMMPHSTLLVIDVSSSAEAEYGVQQSSLQ